MDDFTRNLDGVRVMLGTAGPSIFVDICADGIQTLGREDVDALRRWLDEASEKMRLFEEQD